MASALHLSHHLSHNFRSIYLSTLLGSHVVQPDGEFVGTLKDLLALNEEHPKIIGCLLKTKIGDSVIIEWDGISVTEEDHKYQLILHRKKDLQPSVNAIFLNKQILDKQIVDINDKKVVRVNDIRLAFVSGGVFPIAVDVGLTGFLRRLGVVEVISTVFGIFNRPVPSKLILWQDIGVLALDARNIKLSVTHTKLNTLHPSDLSDIIEDLDSKTRTALFESLDHEKAADVLEEMEEDAKVDIVEDLPIEKAADLLEKLPSDEAADILDDLAEEKTEQLLSEMDKDASQEIRELMEYAEDTAGSIMSTDFMSFAETTTPAQILSDLRRLKPEADSIYSIYVVDSDGKLIGEISLRDLVVHELDLPLSSMMNRRLLHVFETDPFDELIKLVSKYSLLAVPVVTKEMILVGTIVIDDIIYQALRRKRPRI